MISAGDIEARIVAALPGAVVEVEDLTGTQDHWSARVVSATFEGQPLVKRHRAIYGVLKAEMGGVIHALQLETLTPNEAD